MKINVQVAQDAIAGLQKRGKAPASLQNLRKRLLALGVKLEPVHPGEDDPLLAPHFVVDVPDDEALVARVRKILDKSPLIAAAYVKPADELP